MIQPIGETILVDVLVENKVGSIITLTDTQAYTRAKVLAIGDSEKIKFGRGDVVIMPKEIKGIKITGNTYLMNYANVVALDEPGK